MLKWLGQKAAFLKGSVFGIMLTLLVCLLINIFTADKSVVKKLVNSAIDNASD